MYNKLGTCAETLPKFPVFIGAFLNTLQLLYNDIERFLKNVFLHG